MVGEYILLLNEKQKLLNEIFYYTKSKNFKKSEDEADRIEYYLEERQVMYDKLLYVENKIKSMNINNINNKEVDNIIKKNDEIIKDILRLDEEKKEVISAILSILKKEIRNTKNISKANNGYLGTYQDTISGNLFDSSR